MEIHRVSYCLLQMPTWQHGKQVPTDIQRVVCSEAYNLIDASLKYSLDADCQMFYSIITDELGEPPLVIYSS